MAGDVPSTQISSWIATITIALLTAAIIAGASAVVLVIVHDSRIHSLEEWRKSSFFNSPRYTPTDGERDINLCRQWVETEIQNRREADIRISEKIQEITTDVRACKEYQSNHRVESAQSFARIEQIERILKNGYK